MPDTKEDVTAKWESYAAHYLKGRTIVDVKYMVPASMPGHWGCRALVLVLDDNTVIYPASDAAGNAPGVLVGHSPPPGSEELLFPAII